MVLYQALNKPDNSKKINLKKWKQQIQKLTPTKLYKKAQK